MYLLRFAEVGIIFRDKINMQNAKQCSTSAEQNTISFSEKVRDGIVIAGLQRNNLGVLVYVCFCVRVCPHMYSCTRSKD